MRGVVTAVLALVVASGTAAGAVAKARLAAGAAAVTFPVGTPEIGTGTPDTRHGDPSIMMLALTFDKKEISPEALEALVAALRSMQAWHVFAPDSQQGFLFLTANFPDSLARGLWAEHCKPPSADPREMACRPVKVGGATGREYLVKTRDPLRPFVRPYSVQRIVLRKDHLYLLAYDGAEDDALPESEHPSTPEQKAFLESLRFRGP